MKIALLKIITNAVEAMYRRPGSKGDVTVLSHSAEDTIFKIALKSLDPKV